MVNNIVNFTLFARDFTDFRDFWGNVAMEWNKSCVKRADDATIVIEFRTVTWLHADHNSTTGFPFGPHCSAFRGGPWDAREK